jgi:hypothetical protein
MVFSRQTAGVELSVLEGRRIESAKKLRSG